LEDFLQKVNNWLPENWKKKIALQQPVYENESNYNKILKLIKIHPPIICPGEVDNLLKQIAEASEGKRFILQGGDCVERFIDCNEEFITNKIKILLQMSMILTYAARRSVLRIGRIAGQFSKPRSSNIEIVNNQEMFTYKGDSINSFEAETNLRKPDPERLLNSYYFSAITLNYIRAMIAGGFTDLHYPYNWNLYSIEKTKQWKKYRDVVENIMDAVNFMESFGGANTEQIKDIEFFTSHEGLHLGYEEALTRKDKRTGRYYNLGAHMIWIGERTRDVNGAHVEYFKGIENPIGIKISNKITESELLELLNILNPRNEKGRITLITRMGAKNVKTILPGLIKSVNKANLNVSWVCDPMHGNTITTRNNIKTRRFNEILDELRSTFEIHKNNNSYLAGMHFELTGEDVTECTGGAIKLNESDLNRNYQTYCDPRLNYSQSMEMSFLIANLLRVNY